MQQLCQALWLVYLSFAPIYWLPYVSADLFLTAKKLLIASATIATLTYGMVGKKIRIPMGFVGLTGFILILISFFPGVILGDINISIKFLMNLGYAFCTFFCFSIIYQSNPKCLRYFAYSSLSIAVFCLYSVLAKLGLVTDYIAPSNFENSFVVTKVSTAGFTGLRTGWSNGVSFYIPLAIYIIITSESRLFKIVGLIAILCIFLSQVTVAGRAGMLSSLLGCLFLIYFYANKLHKTVFLSVIFIAFIAYLPSLDEHLRLDRIESGVNKETLNHLSAGRIGNYVYAIEIIKGNPLIGVGFGNTDIGGHSIHNMFLRLAAETGLFVILVFSVMIISALMYFKQLKTIKGGLVLIAIILQGVFMAQFEPSTLLLAFQNSTIWWTALGIISGIAFVFKNLRVSKIKVNARRTPLYEK